MQHIEIVGKVSSGFGGVESSNIKGGLQIGNGGSPNFGGAPENRVGGSLNQDLKLINQRSTSDGSNGKARGRGGSRLQGNNNVNQDLLQRQQKAKNYNKYLRELNVNSINNQNTSSHPN